MPEKTSANNKLLVCLAQPVPCGSHVSEVRNLCRENVDWELLLFQVFANGLTGLAGDFFQTYDIQGVPLCVLEELRTGKKNLVRKNLRLVGELIRIKEAMIKAGVRAVPYKGPTLEQIIYGDIGIRMYDDLDMLIQASDVNKSIDVLASLGYNPEADYFKTHEIMYMSNECELNFVHKEGALKAELHWRVVPASFNSALDYDNLTVPAKAGEETGLPADIRSEELLIMLAAHNGYKHFYDKLSWLTDIKGLILKSGIDWNRLFLKAGNLNCAKILMLGLVLTDEVLGLDLPDVCKNYVNRGCNIKSECRKLTGKFFEKDIKEPGTIAKISFRCGMQDNGVQRLKCLLKSIFYPTESDIQWIHIPDQFRRLYYFIRPIRLILKTIRTLFRKKTVSETGDG